MNCPKCDEHMMVVFHEEKDKPEVIEILLECGNHHRHSVELKIEDIVEIT